MPQPPRTSSSVALRLIVTAVPFVLAAAVAAFVLRPIHLRDLPREVGALTFVDRNGLLLGTILGRDERHTMPIPLARVAPVFLQAILATEDRRFFSHGALDPLGVARALATGARERRWPHGASTLTMQLARQLAPVAPTPLGQLREIVMAQRLENGLAKDEILEAYVNRAPMGSNLYGVEAAARTYFGCDAAHLDLAQAALLAGLPNDPVRLDPYAHPVAARRRQRLVLDRMRANGAIDARTEGRAAAEHLSFETRAGGILAAPHALFFLAGRVAPERDLVRTTLDRPLQRFVEQQTRAVVAELARNDVRQAAAIVIENRTGDVLAYAGSQDYFDDDQGGRNDGVQARRQPGSTLKPFLYELALERRIVRPQTILADVPVSYALTGARIYRPVDYAQHFAGPVRTRIALADSLNVPAVRVLERTSVAAFLTRLHRLGFASLTKAPSFYGLGLTLGGGEVSLYELARAYLILARAGAPAALRLTRDGAVPADGAAGAAPGDPAWAFVTDVLADPVARSAAFGTNSILSLPFAAAVKTGTSADFRDTWTAGFTRDYTVAVWVGNFDGHPMRGISGVTGAAPLWNRIMLHLHDAHEPAAFSPPVGYRHVALCAPTGQAPSSRCPAVVQEWLDSSDRAELATASRHPRQQTRDEAAYDEWLIAQPQRKSLDTRILFPHDGDAFVAERARSLKIELAGTRNVRVTLDGSALAAQSGDYLAPLALGRHELRARSPSGRSIVHFAVVAAPPRRHGFRVVSEDRSPGTSPPSSYHIR